MNKTTKLLRIAVLGAAMALTSVSAYAGSNCGQAPSVTHCSSPCDWLNLMCGNLLSFICNCCGSHAASSSSCGSSTGSGSTVSVS